MIKNKVKRVLSLVLAAFMCISVLTVPNANAESIKISSAKVKLGIDNIDNYIDVFKNKKVGLITNQSGMDSNFESSIDVLNAKTKLTSLFAAEHGIRGNSQDGGTVGNEKDIKTGLPIYSLYGSTKKPTADMLKNVDVLAYDIQDVGARFYTFINTMAYAMQACAENNKTFVVFDRPNPVSGTQFQGNILNDQEKNSKGNPKYVSFVGLYPILQRYGLTIGEYAKYLNKEFNINCNLVVVPMTGWTRDMYYDETGLKTWVMPSPNMPTLDTAIVYTGNCVFEGTNVSEGRGTTRPFELIGAPWINSIELAKKMNSLNLPGVKFRAVSFTPTFSKYSASDTEYNNTGKAQTCGGVQTYVTDRNTYNSVKTGLALLYTIRDMYPNNFKYRSDNYIDLLTGDSYVREGKYNLQQLFEKLDSDSNAFKQVASKYFIYTEVNKNNDHNTNSKIKLGIDNIDQYKNVFEGKKVGLITNQSGMNSNFESSIDVLNANTKLTSLFAAEHGIRGNNQNGGTVGSEIDEATGLPVYSLYGNTKKPTADMLKNVDILAYDMQDVGARFYTFINTMAYAMQACAENNKTFVVFDRPNPVSGTQFQGNILNDQEKNSKGNPKYVSFVGMYPILQRYGLTIGEYAKYLNKEFNINCNLVVIPMSGWTRDMYYDETGLKTWVMPSPNMPTLDTAIVYTGNCVFEGTNVSEGRGTTRPFELIGAPWINSIDLSDKMNSLNLPGVKFRAVSFTPMFSKYSDSDDEYNNTGRAQTCGGVQTYVTDRNAYNSVKTGLALLYTIRDMYPNDFKYTSDNYVDLLTGDSYVREGKYNLQQLFDKLDNDSNTFKQVASKYFIYKDNATLAVEKAEQSMKQADLDSAKVIVNALQDENEKSALLIRLNAVQELIDAKNALDSATSAVVKAEESLKQSDVDAAKVIIDKLQSGNYKDNLTQRIDAVQKKINDKISLDNATSAVIKAEKSLSQSDVDAAKILVSKVVSGNDKDNLTQRINAVQKLIDAKTALDSATSAVVKAEKSQSQTDVDAAMKLVNELPDGSDKTALLSRINGIKVAGKTIPKTGSMLDGNLMILAGLLFISSGCILFNKKNK